MSEWLVRDKKDRTLCICHSWSEATAVAKAFAKYRKIEPVSLYIIEAPKVKK